MNSTRLNNQQKAKLKYVTNKSPTEINVWGLWSTKEKYMAYIKQKVLNDLGPPTSEIIAQIIKEREDANRENARY